jgi:CDP-paratose 2-epimerase
MGKGESSMKVIITGGAGFIGANIARRHIEKGDFVIIIDDLSRKGSVENIKKLHNSVIFYQRDITLGNLNDIFEVHKDVDIVYHMAAQVAVTKSVQDPIRDFAINAYGTLYILDLIRGLKINPLFIYASTNKVYGSLEDAPYSVDENTPLDFHSPYGCSKGTAEQYVRDFSRIYGLNTVVFRQSCIYGPLQTGIEDQGWLSWFCQKFNHNGKINIYGTGKQIRDILYIDDLLDLYDIAYKKREEVNGQIFNAGGGIENAISLLELIDILEHISGKSVPIEFNDWRSGDQKRYVSNIGKAKSLGWEPKIIPSVGIKILYDWTLRNIK